MRNCMAVVWWHSCIIIVYNSRNLAKDKKPEDPNRKFLRPLADSVKRLLNGTTYKCVAASLMASQNWQKCSENMNE